MKKLISMTLLSVIFAVILATPPVSAQFTPKKDPTKGKVNIDENTYQTSGVVIDKALVKPGEKLPVLWGIMGPPDKIWAMRGKKSVNDDYVKLDYYIYGISFDITSKNNNIKGILVEQNGQSFQLSGVPFKIGQNQNNVITKWGEPDNSAPGLMAYWRRGVFIGLDDSGKIVHIYITSPGKLTGEESDDE